MTDEWDDDKKEEISVKEMDAAFTELVAARLAKDEAKDIEKQAGKVLEACNKKVLDLLTRSGKDGWKVDGVGSVSKRTKMSVPTPKSREDKEALSTFLQGYDIDIYWKLIAPNSASLNSFYNELLLENPELSVPGLEARSARETLAFRKA